MNYLFFGPLLYNCESTPYKVQWNLANSIHQNPEKRFELQKTRVKEVDLHEKGAFGNLKSFELKEFELREFHCII